MWQTHISKTYHKAWTCRYSTSQHLQTNTWQKISSSRSLEATVSLLMKTKTKADQSIFWRTLNSRFWTNKASWVPCWPVLTIIKLQDATTQKMLGCIHVHIWVLSTLKNSPLYSQLTKRLMTQVSKLSRRSKCLIAMKSSTSSNSIPQSTLTTKKKIYWVISTTNHCLLSCLVKLWRAMPVI